MGTLTDIRMACHQLAEPEFGHPADLVGWMGAMQAQDYTMSKWAVGLRLRSATIAQVNEALAKGEIVRTHIMRPTWHYVAGKDLRWMLQLTSSRLKKVIDSWVKASGLDISENQYIQCNDLIGKMLSGGNCLTREEIEMELGHAGVPVAGDRVRRYVLRAEMEGIVCSGADKNGKPGYALLDEQVAPASSLPREEALARLALNYFRSHSPATLKDFVWWSGLTVTEAQQAIGSIKELLVEEHFEGQAFWVFAACRKTENRDLIQLLPPFDEYLVSYKDRTPVIPEKHHSKAFNRWGTFYPVILYGGQIIGNWSKVKKKEGVTVTVSFFDKRSKCPLKLLQEVEKQYRKFVDGYVPD